MTIDPGKRNNSTEKALAKFNIDGFVKSLCRQHKEVSLFTVVTVNDDLEEVVRVYKGTYYGGEMIAQLSDDSLDDTDAAANAIVQAFKKADRKVVRHDWDEEYTDTEVVGINSDGYLMLWNDEMKDTYNTDEKLEDVDDLTDKEKARLGIQ